MLVHDAFSVEFYSFLTSKDKMAAADKEKSAGIPVVCRAFLTQSDVDRLFFEAMIPYERSPNTGSFFCKFLVFMFLDLSCCQCITSVIEGIIRMSFHLIPTDLMGHGVF